MSVDSLKALGNAYHAFAKWLAILGGLVLVGMSTITVISVAGRYLFSSPIVGDSEITQMFTAVAVALSLPYCHLRNGNVLVDVFTANLNPRHIIKLDFIGSALLSVLLAVLAYYAYLGGLDAMRYGNETMMLRMKEWWFYLTIAFGCGLTSVAGIVVCLRQINELWGDDE
jgi:TRAP-type C4-dicarboxylate transport system permease small subunit